MCDFFGWQRTTAAMDPTNTSSSSSAAHDLGDLADIVRAGDRLAAGGGPGAGMEFVAGAGAGGEWQLLMSDNKPTTTQGDPFRADLSGFEDLIAAPPPPPTTTASMMSLKHDGDAVMDCGAAMTTTTMMMRMPSVNAGGGCGGGCFTRMMAAPPPPAAAPPTLLRPMSTSSTTSPAPAVSMKLPPPPASLGPLTGDVAVGGGGAGPISAPRTPVGIKRRKSQAKKVVCVPAPAAASNRQSGEVVPSDLWAWRKYGQKPIKGSPYPRGYYRCSSSKGCSARKQVERCRTDPNMLVITYTSEHNHPWPTQRNSAAGAVRSHHPSSSSSSPATKNAAAAAAAKTTSGTNRSSSINIAPPLQSFEEATPAMSAVLYESGEQEFDELIFGNCGEGSVAGAGDFFAVLAELESDPVSLIFSGGGGEYARMVEEEDDDDGGLVEMMIGAGKVEEEEDPFSIFDWGGGDVGFDSKVLTTTLKKKNNDDNGL